LDRIPREAFAPAEIVTTRQFPPADGLTSGAGNRRSNFARRFLERPGSARTRQGFHAVRARRNVAISSVEP